MHQSSMLFSSFNRFGGKIMGFIRRLTQVRPRKQLLKLSNVGQRSTSRDGATTFMRWKRQSMPYLLLAMIPLKGIRQKFLPRRLFPYLDEKVKGKPLFAPFNYLVIFMALYLSRDVFALFFTRLERTDQVVRAVVPTIDLSAYVTPTFLPTPTPRPLFMTPTSIPSPTPTVFLHSALFSYYDPALLGVNCHPDNVINGVCGPTASGLDWKTYDRLIAVPLDYPYPLHTRIFVRSPDFLRGEWIIADYCPGCKSFLENYYLDFLINSSRWCSDESLPCPIPWGTNVIYEVLE